VIGEYDYSHPVFDLAAIAAQRALPQIQGRAHVWFCGAWTRYGFHEDGLMSALAVVSGRCASALGRVARRAVAA
jgi:predicted NAD/FAD-binding protein